MQQASEGICSVCKEEIKGGGCRCGQRGEVGERLHGPLLLGCAIGGDGASHPNRVDMNGQPVHSGGFAAPSMFDKHPGKVPSPHAWPGAEVYKKETPANARQVGGSHYKSRAIEPWDFAAANGLDYFQGSVVKYVVRYRDKNGLEDLEKAKHYIDKMIELETAKIAATKGETKDAG